MKKIARILLSVAMLVMLFSMTAFAATDANVFTITTDVTSVKTGETVIVDVELTGDLANAAMVQLSVKFDNTKFSTVTSGRAPWGFDSTWYNSTKDGNPDNLGYINTPSMGENPAGQVNVMFLSTDGYFIDDAGALYGDNKTTTAAKIKFTALADVDVIDSSCFELLNCKVEEDDKSAHAITVNQLAAPGPVVKPGKDEKPVTITANEITLNDIKYTNVAVFNASHTLTLEDGENITEAGIEVNDTSVLTFPSLAGETGGTIEYNAIIYGVTGDLKVETYFAGNFLED